MNHFVGIGRLVRDPNVKYTQSGKAYASFTLAIDRRKGADGAHKADFIPCVAWEKTAEVIAQYCAKGRKIAVEGRIQTRSYEKDGRKNYVTEVVVQSMEFCESKGGGQGAGSRDVYPGTAVPDEDIPF